MSVGTIEFTSEEYLALIDRLTDKRFATSMELAKANADWFAAIHAAQLKMETVGKDGENTQSKYSYATAENMIRGSREPLAGAGLAFFSTWSTVPVRSGDQADTQSIGNQTVGAMVTMHWVLSHSSGGYVEGTADMAAICSPRRPPDKAVAATLTYMRGFVLRDLLNMDRQEEPGGAVDQRDDDTGDRPRNGNGGVRPEGRREDTGEEKDRQAKAAYEEKAKPLREKSLGLAAELEAKTHQGFALQRTAAKVPQTGRMSVNDLTRFITWAEAKLDELDGHGQPDAPDPEDDVPAFELEPPGGDK